MKLKTILTGALLLTFTTLSGLQVYAAAAPNESINTDVVYTINDAAPTADSDESLKQMYSDQAFKVLEDYFGLTQDKLPANSTFFVRLYNTASLNKDEAKWISDYQEQLDQKKISQAEFDNGVKEIHAEFDDMRANIQKLGRDDVGCKLISPNLEMSANSFYIMSINPNTKEVYKASVPMTAEGWKIQTETVGLPGEKVKSFSVPEATVAARKEFCVEYIKKLHLGGIENPEFVQIHGSTHNHYIYKSADDTQYVRIDFDPSTTTKVISFTTDTAYIKKLLK